MLHTVTSCSKTSRWAAQISRRAKMISISEADFCAYVQTRNSDFLHPQAKSSWAVVCDRLLQPAAGRWLTGSLQHLTPRLAAFKQELLFSHGSHLAHNNIPHGARAWKGDLTPPPAPAWFIWDMASPSCCLTSDLTSQVESTGLKVHKTSNKADFWSSSDQALG